jgi:predicted AAA+ superfamily ATPase
VNWLEDWKSISFFQVMVDRILVDLLRRRQAQFPAVTLVGPRQCGKTTLARTLANLPDYLRAIAG